MKKIVPGLNVEFREADLPDSGMLGYLYYESWAASMKGVLPDRYLEPYTPEALAEAMRRLIGTTYADYFIAYIDGEPSGFGAGDYYQNPDAGEITHLFLLPQYWGMGYGAMMLDHTMDKLRERGMTRAGLWVNTTAQRAVRLYERRGFLLTGESEELFLGGVTQRQVRYERAL